MTDVGEWFRAASVADPRIHGYGEEGVHDRKLPLTVYVDESDADRRRELSGRLRAEFPNRDLTVVWCGRPVLM